METAAGSPLPDKFHSFPGGVFPLYHVLADVGEFAQGEVIPATSSEPLRVDGLVLHQDGRQRVLLANLSDRPQQVRIEGLPAQVQVRRLDETNAEQAMQSPETFRAQGGEPVSVQEGVLTLTLLPYAIARIDQT
jgi:hypothetical protein